MNSTFEEILEHDGQLLYTNVGDSMMPLLRERRDILVISPKPEGRLSMLDIPLYKRDTGKYVLHRVMWVRKNDYIICGDNQYYPERGIGERHIIGVLTAVIRNGKRLEMNSLSMRLYGWMQWLLFPYRAVILYTLRSLWPKIKRKFSKK